jgi:hypothetical protein
LPIAVFHGGPSKAQATTLDHRTAAAEQINDQNHKRDHQQKVNQTPCYVQAKAKQPQNQ